MQLIYDLECRIIFLGFYIVQVFAKCVFDFNSEVSKIGNFSSPVFPDFYPRNSNCQYHFKGKPNEGIEISFFVFDLEYPAEKGCLNDYIDISTFNTQHIKEFFGRFCGSLLPRPILLMSPHLEIVFRTNYAVQHRGFHGMYEFIDEARVPPPTSSSEIPDCGGMVTGVGGIIKSPGYPSAYPGNIDCIWLLRVQYSRRIFIRILEMQLGGSIADCHKSELAVHDGYANINTNNGRVLRLCGDLMYYTNEQEKSYISHRNRLFIRFTALHGIIESQPTEKIGFNIVWTEVALEAGEDKCKKFYCKKGKYCLHESKCSQPKQYCIDTSLVCNGMPNCGLNDQSDEDYCMCSFCYYPLLIGLGVAIPIVVVCAALFVTIYRRTQLSKSSSQSQHLTMQLRQLDHSPSTTSRHMYSGYLQAPVNSDTEDNFGPSSYDIIITSRFKGAPTRV